MRDATRKGRLKFTITPRGETHHNAKLNPEMVAEVWALIDAGQSTYAVARKFGVRDGSIKNILTGRAWREASERLGRLAGARVR